MLKQITQFKSVINEIENTFHFDANCPTTIAKEALFDALKWIGQIEDAAKKQAEDQPKADDEEKKVEAAQDWTLD